MFYALAIFAPITLLMMFGVSMYIRTSARKLFEEMQRKGLLVYSFPIVIPGAIIDMDRSNRHRTLVSPATGLPPPPSYTAEYSQNTSPNTGLPPPPSYTSIFKTPPNIQSVQSVSG